MQVLFVRLLVPAAIVGIWPLKQLGEIAAGMLAICVKILYFVGLTSSSKIQ
jgi:hypothetical protein